MPADPGLNEEIILLGSVSADLAERNLQTVGANTRGFRQHFAEIALAKRVGAEFRKRRLLSSKPPDLGRFTFAGICLPRRCRVTRSTRRTL